MPYEEPIGRGIEQGAENFTKMFIAGRTNNLTLMRILQTQMKDRGQARAAMERLVREQAKFNGTDPKTVEDRRIAAANNAQSQQNTVFNQNMALAGENRQRAEGQIASKIATMKEEFRARTQDFIDGHEFSPEAAGSKKLIGKVSAAIDESVDKFKKMSFVKSADGTQEYKTYEDIMSEVFQAKGLIPPPQEERGIVGKVLDKISPLKMAANIALGGTPQPGQPLPQNVKDNIMKTQFPKPEALAPLTREQMMGAPTGGDAAHSGVAGRRGGSIIHNPETAIKMGLDQSVVGKIFAPDSAVYLGIDSRGSFVTVPKDKADAFSAPFEAEGQQPSVPPVVPQSAAPAPAPDPSYGVSDESDPDYDPTALGEE